MEPNKENKIEETVSSALNKLKSIIDVSTVVGDPVKNDFDAVILPISKVSMGFVAGGGEYKNERNLKKNQSYPFAGGSGAGVVVSPIGFLTITKGVPNFIRVENRTSLDKIADLLPEILEKLTKKTENKNAKNS